MRLLPPQARTQQNHFGRNTPAGGARRRNAPVCGAARISHEFSGNPMKALNPVMRGWRQVAEAVLAPGYQKAQDAHAVGWRLREACNLDPGPGPAQPPERQRASRIQGRHGLLKIMLTGRPAHGAYRRRATPAGCSGKIDFACVRACGGSSRIMASELQIPTRILQQAERSDSGMEKLNVAHRSHLAYLGGKLTSGGLDLEKEDMPILFDRFYVPYNLA